MIYNYDLINELTSFLKSLNYHVINLSVLGDAYVKNPLPPYNIVKSAYKKLADEKQKLMSFLLLGEPITKTILDKYLSNRCLLYLYEEGIMNCDETDYWFNNFVITSHQNCFFLVSTPYYYPTCQNTVPSPYIGIDTYWLTNTIINYVHGTVLDLCTGSGIQAIISAQSCEKVYAVDLDEKALTIARFNSYLNGVQNKITFFLGNLYEPIPADIKFDFILSNPPFIPMPERIDDYPISGAGGDDGLKIVRQIYNGYLKYLKKNGQGLMIGQAIGNKEKIFMCDEMQEKFLNCFCKTIVFNETLMSVHVESFLKLCQYIKCNMDNVSFDEWQSINDANGATHLYSFLTIVQNSFGGFNIEYLYNRWNAQDIPYLNPCEIKEDTKKYIVSLNGVSISIDEETYFYITNIDGKLSLEEIVDKIPFRFKIKYGKNVKSILIGKYSQVLSNLQQHGFVKQSTQIT